MLFNRQLITHHRNKFIMHAKNCIFYNYVIQDIIERLSLLNNSFGQILVLGGRDGKIIQNLQKLYPNANFTVTEFIDNTNESLSYVQFLKIDEEEIAFNQKFDLIIYCFGMHWINDLPKFLYKIQNHLNDNGIFIGNLIGGESFKSLKARFIEIEEQTSYPHYFRFSPYVKFDDLTKLLTHACFDDVIVDQEKIILEYKSPFALIRELSKFGEANKLYLRESFSISKNMYKLLEKEDALIDNVYLMSFIACKQRDVLKIQNR